MFIYFLSVCRVYFYRSTGASKYSLLKFSSCQHILLPFFVSNYLQYSNLNKTINKTNKQTQNSITTFQEMFSLQSKFGKWICVKKITASMLLLKGKHWQNTESLSIQNMPMHNNVISYTIYIQFLFRNVSIDMFNIAFDSSNKLTIRQRQLHFLSGIIYSVIRWRC